MRVRAGELVAAGVARIPLTKGYFALIDEADLQVIGRFNWSARTLKWSSGYVYAIRTALASESGPRTVSMHRQIVAASADLHVDHRSGDTLDNRRINLRVCTPEENHRNTRRVSALAGFKGVQATSWGRWRASITVSKKVLPLGTYDTPEEAALAYDAAAISHFGEFAATNRMLGLLR